MRTFDAGDSLGARPRAQIAEYLNEIEDHEGAAQFASPMASGQSAVFWGRKPWEHTAMVLGYIAPDAPPSAAVQGISSVQADRTLINKRIKVTLDKFHVADYPGMGVHSILCEFVGKNQVPNETEELSFALRCQARDNAAASIAGAPIFMGLTLGRDGISFKGRTVNVQSSTDEKILATFDTPAFKNGLALLSTAQPALKPLAGLAAAAVETTISRRRNVQVHSFDLGLDFEGGATSARLRTGSYLVVQSDDGAAWDWTQFRWNADGHSLVNIDPAAGPVNFNYMVFGVSRFSDEP
ncbi:MAG: hypothetical protein DI587_24825 [Variovorax paradoxus]|nr:MAG: hypothetical protein DI583_24825 [Variovorax paradoxus]PZQ05441.1 MAG: hypothetical protein DI587_24825 [Variovorax paradoxus]